MQDIILCLCLKNFNLDLVLLKLFRKKLIYVPSGCYDTETQENFSKLDNGNVCNNCGSKPQCHDDKNKKHFAILNKYFDLSIGDGVYHSSQMNQTVLKYKSLNLKTMAPRT